MWREENEKELRCGAQVGEKEWKREWGRKLVPAWHSSTGLISFYVLSISLRHLSRQEEREAEGGGRDSKRGNKLGRKKGSGLTGQRRAIDPGLTVRGTDSDTDRHVVQFSRPFCLIYQPHYQTLSLALPHIPFTHSHASYRRWNHSRQTEWKVEVHHWHYCFKYGGDGCIKGWWGGPLALSEQSSLLYTFHSHR